MKKIVPTILALCSVFLSIISVYASEPCFELNSITAKSGRLITIDMYAEYGDSLSAASFEFNFNSDMLEFREAKCNDNTALIKTSCTGNTIKSVYLNSNGTNISDKTCLFSLTFKTLCEGESYVDFSVSDCVNSKIERITSGQCVSAAIKVSGNSSANSSDSEKTDKSSSSSTNKGDASSKSRRGKTQNDDSNENGESTIDNLGILNPLNDNIARYIFAGIAIGAGFAGVIAAVFVLGRKSAVRKINNNDDNGQQTSTYESNK